jgi:two-component system sensor histidine kinase RpfC
MAVLFMSAAALLFGGALLRPQPSPIRRCLGMALDLTTTSAVLVSAGEGGMPLFGVYLWVTMGNGFRYGKRYLAAAAVMSVVGFSVALVLSDYWGRHTTAGIGLVIVLLAIPLYMGSLLSKLNAAIRRAQEASQAKSQFLARMSHELRTPLNGVIGMSELLVDSRLDSKHLETVRSIQLSATTLRKIIEDILDFSKIEAGRTEIESTDFDLHRLVTETVRMVKGQATQKGIGLSVNMDARVPYSLRGDPFHIRQVLANLLSNALKFTDHGEVALRVTCASEPVAETSGARCCVRFEVEDTGIGMSAEQERRIFDSFQQADSSVTRRFGGTGLGTTIARELVTLMGGTIGLHSSPGQGSLFWFEIPLAKQAPTAIQGEDGIRDRLALVVGEGPVSQTLGVTLSHWGVRHVLAPSPSAALTILRGESGQQLHFSVVLVVASEIQLNAVAFADQVRGEQCAMETSLVLVDADSTGAGENGRLVDGYSAVFFSPLDRTLLFNHLHAAHIGRGLPDNVIPLADYYQRVAARPNQRLRILIAEDNETNRQVLEEILQRVGHEVLAVDDGEKALDVLDGEHDRLDLMILDMNMPMRGGLEVFRAYRFMERRHPIPTIILTADATADALRACTEAKVDAYLTKPLDARKILATVARLTENRISRYPTAACHADSSSMGREVKQGSVAATESQALVDEAKLGELLQLGLDRRFFDKLVSGFLRDGEHSLRELEAAIEGKDYPRLRGAIHALQGSAGELGATRMVAVCNELKQLKPFQLATPGVRDLVQDARQAFSQTGVVLTDFGVRRAMPPPSSRD